MTLSVSILVQSSICAIADDYSVMEVEGSDDSWSCLYVSNEPIWPYASEDGENQADAECAKMGISLAELNEDEKVALQELTSKIIIARLIANSSTFN